MISFYQKYSDSGKYTQFGEYGILTEALRRIKPKRKEAVEFGAPSFTYCSNTAHLHDQGWTVRMYDIDKNPDPRILQAEVTPDNVNELVGSPVVLSIDCDGPDYTIWEAYKGKPDIVVIEIDSSIRPPQIQLPSRHNAASYQYMVALGIEKGYFLLCHTSNCVFVLNKHRKLFPEITGDGLLNWEEYFDKRHLK